MRKLKLLLLLSISVLVSVPAIAQFYYAPYLQLSSSSNVSTALGNLNAAQTARVNVIPLRVIANGYGTPPDIVTYAVVAPNTSGDDAPASTLPDSSWTVGGCMASFALDGNGRNVWSATAYASVSAAMTDRDSDSHIRAVAYVLTPVTANSPALLVMPNLSIHCQ